LGDSAGLLVLPQPAASKTMKNSAVINPHAMRFFFTKHPPKEV
jgi:hypothetical protein